jgi:osmotically-inducible protein OsmY
MMESRRKASAVWIVGLLLLLGALAGNRVQAQDKDASADASITRQVERALAEDRALGSMDIKVETQNAVVSLTGFVRSLEDITKAGGLAKAVRGVSAVRNGLRVANRPSQA